MENQSLRLLITETNEGKVLMVYSQSEEKWITKRLGGVAEQTNEIQYMARPGIDMSGLIDVLKNSGDTIDSSDDLELEF